MKPLSLSLKTYQIQKPKKKGSERAEIVGMFLERLNAERGTFKPLTAARVGMMLSVFKTTGEMRQFYGSCNDAKCFSKYFFWSLNPKNYKV